MIIFRTPNQSLLYVQQPCMQLNESVRHSHRVYILIMKTQTLRAVPVDGVSKALLCFQGQSKARNLRLYLG